MPHPYDLSWIVLYSTEPWLREQAMAYWDRNSWSVQDAIIGTICA